MSRSGGPSGEVAPGDKTARAGASGAAGIRDACARVMRVDAQGDGMCVSREEEGKRRKEKEGEKKRKEEKGKKKENEREGKKRESGGRRDSRRRRPRAAVGRHAAQHVGRGKEREGTVIDFGVGRRIAGKDFGKGARSDKDSETIRDQRRKRFLKIIFSE